MGFRSTASGYRKAGRLTRLRYVQSYRSVRVELCPCGDTVAHLTALLALGLRLRQRQPRMAKRDDIPNTDPSQIEALIQRLKQSNIEPRDAQLVERLLRLVVSREARRSAM